MQSFTSRAHEEEEKSTGTNSSAGQTSEFDAREFSNIELIKKAEECVDNLKLEKAVALYDEGLRRFPNDTLILDQYSDLLIQFGEHAKAGELIQRSIQLNPNKDGHKYLNAAEMLSGHEAVQIYRKGIQVLDADFERHTKALNET